MSKSDKTKHDLQLHLSTALLLLLAASYLVHANFTERTTVVTLEQPYAASDVLEEMVAYGWPSPVLYKFTGKAWYQDGRPYEEPRKTLSWERSYAAIAVDVMFSFAILVVFGIGCEWILRLRESRKSQ